VHSLPNLYLQYTSLLKHCFKHYFPTVLGINQTAVPAVLNTLFSLFKDTVHRWRSEARLIMLVLP
jgi:hypothetical protein